MRTPLVHIGLHKTGTTWLQHRLFRSENSPVRDPLPPGELRDAFVFPPPFGFDPVATRERLRRHLDRLAQHVQPAMSSERLSGNPHGGRFDAEILADRLAATFPEARILIVVREQVSMLLSTWKQYVRVGGTASLGRYLDPPERGRGRLPAFDARTFEYDLLVTAYQERFGHDQVLVLPFEDLRRDPRGFATSIVGFAGADTSNLGDLPKRPVNPAPRAGALVVTRALNRVLVRDRLNPSPFVPVDWGPRVVRGVARGTGGLFGGQTLENRWRRTVESYAAGRFDDANRRLVNATGLDLAARGYAVAAGGPAEP